MSAVARNSAAASDSGGNGLLSSGIPGLRIGTSCHSPDIEDQAARGRRSGWLVDRCPPSRTPDGRPGSAPASGTGACAATATASIRSTGGATPAPGDQAVPPGLPDLAWAARSAPAWVSRSCRVSDPTKLAHTTATTVAANTGAASPIFRLCSARKMSNATPAAPSSSPVSTGPDSRGRVSPRCRPASRTACSNDAHSPGASAAALSASTSNGSGPWPACLRASPSTRSSKPARPPDPRPPDARPLDARALDARALDARALDARALGGSSHSSLPGAGSVMTSSPREPRSRTVAA